MALPQVILDVMPNEMPLNRLLLLIVFWFIACHAAAQTTFNSQEELSEWVTYYYKNPQPNRLPQAIKYMSQTGILDNRNAVSPIFGFISGVFRNNPDKVSAWVAELGSLDDKHFGVVVLGLWYANLSTSQGQVYSLLEARQTEIGLRVLILGESHAHRANPFGTRTVGSRRLMGKIYVHGR